MAMQHEFPTDGEQLVYFLRTKLFYNVPWNRLSPALLPTGRGDELCEFFREITEVNLACRLVAAGSSLMKETSTRPSRDADDPTLHQQLKDYLRQQLLIPASTVNDVLRLVIRAVKASQEQVSDSRRRQYKRQAQKTHPYCYMCGVTLDFSEIHPHTKFTLDHIWPRCYGGNSIDSNLLPACGSCNSGKKRDFASWAMTNIHALVLGFLPTEEERQSVEGSHRYALHHYAVQKFATRRQITLKEAFQHIRPWTEVSLLDSDDLGDFFNLRNHQLHAEG